MAVRQQLAIIMTWWLLRRRWRLVAWTAATGAAIVAVTLPLVGLDAYADFLPLPALPFTALLALIAPFMASRRSAAGETP